MSKQLLVVKILGGIVIVASAALLVFLIKIINKYDMVAFIYLAVPILTSAGGMMMVLSKDAE